MRGRPDAHARFRELIAARLDGPLTRLELRSLTSHLKTCGECRQVDREYRDNRLRLRSLPSPLPPRDLWARTSSALDREVARGSYRRPGYRRVFGPRRGSNVPTAALLTGIAAVAVVGALAMLQLGPSLQRGPAVASSMPTPFAVSPQSLAFIGSGAADVAIYRTQVNQVCPPAAPDCLSEDGIERTAVTLPGNARPRNAALSPSGNQLALVGRNVGEDFIAVVTLPQVDGLSSAGRPTDDPSASGQPNGSDEPGQSNGPAPTEPIAQPSGQNGPDESPDLSPAVPPSSSGAEPPSNVVAILENVQSTGSPPAWSANSETLAFSAMPADGSHGPDVYVWSVGDAHARPITDDHSSYFASWSGRRIVLSRVSGTSKGEAAVETVVIDPASLEQRTVDIAPVWLPAVNPGRTHAVAWYGELGLTDGLPAPRSGALYLVDWAAIDPFADNAPTPTPEPTAEPSTEPTAEPSPEPTSVPSAEPTVGPSAEASGAPSAERPSGSATEPSPEASPKTEATDPVAPSGAPQGGGTEPDTASFDPAVIPDGFVPVEPDRDPGTDPIIDWQAQWSTDGQVLGIWVADVPGSTWGRLVVRALDQREPVALHPDAVVAPALAQRGFTLGSNRVAWVAPAEGDPDGELRIRTWGSDGDGGLRLQPADVDEVVPAF